jgi:TonB family protein
MLQFVVCGAVFCLSSMAQNPVPQQTTPEAQVRRGDACLAQKDYSGAMTWFRKAADQGDAGAETSVGWLYENGYGVKQDFAEAMTWYRKAAAQGNADAQNNVGWLYQNGWGVKQDDAEALTWYRKAAEQGNSRAKANLEVLTKTHAENEAAASSTSGQASAPAVVPSKGIQPPRALFQPEPQFSEEARRAMFTGEVMLALTVTSDGQPRDIKVVAPLGSGLDEKAVDAVKTWKFEPATKDGKPVAVEIMIEVDFGLRLSGVGKVDVVSSLPEPKMNGYLSPLIRAVGQCWNNAVQDKTSAPAVQEGQVTIQFALAKDGKAVATQLVSASGDAVLDGDANNCVSRLRAEEPLPADLQGGDLIVHMQLLYNMAGASLNPGHATIAAGGREQFYIEVAGVLSKAVDWSVAGAGCKDAACGTVSPDGLYTAPDVLPKPALVRVRGTLAGANPIAATAVVMLMNKR